MTGKRNNSDFTFIANNIQVKHEKQLYQQIVELSLSGKVIVAIAGTPASGKSTLAKNLSKHLTNNGYTNQIVQMDDFHYDNKILKEKNILKRKGSIASFDAYGFLHTIKRIAKAKKSVCIPKFSRKEDFSKASSKIIHKKTRIIIVEGNFLFINKKPWNKLQKYFHLCFFLNTKQSTIKKRLQQRWIKYGYSKKEITKKINKNDMKNAKFILKKSDTSSIKII